MVLTIPYPSLLTFFLKKDAIFIENNFLFRLTALFP
jgi:hypothetical protein